MKVIRYKILRRDDWQLFGPFTLGDVTPKITGALEYLLCATVPDSFGAELWDGDLVSFTSDEGFGGEGQIVFDRGVFSIKSKHNAALLANCRFIKRLGSIYDKEVADGG